MRLNLDKDWFAAQSELEEGLEVTAGLPAGDRLLAEAGRARGLKKHGGQLLALGRLVNLKRREAKISPEELAEQADIDLHDLLAIERGDPIEMEPRTILQLSDVLSLPSTRLLQLSGLATERDEDFRDEAVRFAARSEPLEQLTREQEKALHEFVKYLCER